MTWRRWLVAGGGVALTIAACGGSTVVEPGGTGAGGAGGSGGTAAGTTSSGGSGTGSTTGTGGGSCDGPGQCELTFPGCCAPCGEPQLTQLVAIPLDELDAYHQAQCPEPEPCPECLSCDNGELLSYCDAGACAGAHVDDFGLRDCTGDDDCQLRWGSRCYEPCGGIADCDGLTAINTGALGMLSDLVCDPDAPPPPPCVPTYPDDAIAICNAGTCEVLFVDP